MWQASTYLKLITVTAGSDDLASVAEAFAELRPFSKAKDESLEKHIYELMRGPLVDTRPGEHLARDVPRIKRESLDAYVSTRKARASRLQDRKSRDRSRDGRDSIQILSARIGILLEEKNAERIKMLAALEAEIAEHRDTAAMRDSAQREARFGMKLLQARLDAESQRANDEEAVRRDLQLVIAQEVGPSGSQDVPT